MSTGVKPLLEYKRPADCWCCSSCETENDAHLTTCRLCGIQKNDRCLSMKKWTPNVIPVSSYGTGGFSRLQGTASKGEMPYTPPPPNTYSSYSSPPPGPHYTRGAPPPPPPPPPQPSGGSGGSAWIAVVIAAIIVIFAMVLYANAAEPITYQENTNSVSLNDDTDGTTQSYDGIDSEEVSYVL